MYGTLTYVATPRPTWHITAVPHVAIRLKRLFPRMSQTRVGVMQLSATPDVASDLEWLLSRWPLELDPAAKRRLKKDARAHRKVTEQVTQVLEGVRLPGTWRTPGRPARWPHQDANADLITLSKRLLITDSLGAGKTHSALMALRNPDALPALVVVQAHLPRQWQAQIALTWPELTSHIIKKGTVYDPAATKECGGVDPDVLIISYSKLAGWAEHLAGRVNTVIFDEAHELRNGISTAKGHAAARVSDQATYVVGLTNTPVVNLGGDVHSVFSVIRPDVLGSREEFLREWCGLSSMERKPKVADPRALGSYLRDLGVMTGVNLKSSEPIRIPHTVEADPRVFADLAGDASEMARFILERAGTSTQLFQAAGQFDMRMRQATGIAKAPYVAHFVKMLLEQVDKVVLFGWHRAVYDIWMEELATYKPVLYTGSESPAAKRRAEEAFVDGDSRILIMSLKSGAGVDGLQAASHTVVFGELDWSPATHKQAIGRLDRPGQTEPVLAYFLTSDEGADPTMIEVLGTKRRQADPFVDPDAATFTPIDTANRVRQLAEDLLRRKDPTYRVPEPAEPGLVGDEQHDATIEECSHPGSPSPSSS